MNKKEAVTQLEIMATNATGRLCEAKAEERALLYKEIESLNMGIDALKDYKPKTGHWEHIDIKGYPYVACNKCGQIEGWDENTGMYCALVGEKYAHFCPNCGAEMRGNEDER